MTRDPVCGMDVDETSAAAKLEHEGRIYYFCSEGCREAFKKSPGKFAPAKERAPRAAGGGT
jgi:Cu+-exporting ATPase